MRPVSCKLRSRVINRLRQAEGGIVTHEMFAEALWWDSETGGCTNAKGLIRRAIFELKKAGFPIENEHGRGYYYAGKGVIEVDVRLI